MSNILRKLCLSTATLSIGLCLHDLCLAKANASIITTQKETSVVIAPARAPVVVEPIPEPVVAPAAPTTMGSVTMGLAAMAGQVAAGVVAAGNGDEEEAANAVTQGNPAQNGVAASEIISAPTVTANGNGQAPVLSHEMPPQEQPSAGSQGPNSVKTCYRL